MNEFIKWSFILTGLAYLMACTHTIQGMKQDIHEDTAPTQQKHAHPKPVPDVSSPQSLPSSPPPLQNPPS